MDYPSEWETELTTKSGMKVVFRPEHPGDTEMLWEMLSTLSKESISNLLPPFTRERVESWIRDINYNKVLAIVAFITDKNKQRIMGSVSLKFNPQEALKHRAELGLTVHNDYQHRGIGTAMLQHILDVARMKKLSKIYLHVSKDNDRVIHVYNKAGFNIEGKLCKESCINGKYRDEYTILLLL